MLRRVELQDVKHADQAEFAQQQRGLTTPAPLTQHKDIPGLPPWVDGDRSVLFADVSNTPHLPFQLSPTIARPLPGGYEDPTGLLGSAVYFTCNVYAEQGNPHVPYYPPHKHESLIDYDILEGWLNQHLPPADDTDAIVLFTDNRPLHDIHAWQFTERLWRHRFSRRGPCQEKWIGLYVPLDQTTGLANLHCAWSGVFAAEACPWSRSCYQTYHRVEYKRWKDVLPLTDEDAEEKWLSDTDAAPTCLT